MNNYYIEKLAMVCSDRQLEDELKEKWPKTYNALFGDIEPAKQELLKASLFIMTYECLKDFVEGKFRGFYIEGFETRDDGDVVDIFSPRWSGVKEKQKQRYKELARTLANVDVGRVTLFQEACAWLHENEAITDEDVVEIIRVSKMRNDLAHELYKWIFDESVPKIDDKSINSTINLHFKISNWWVRNIEAAIMPENYERFSEEDMLSAASIDIQFLQVMIKRLII